MKKEEFKVGMVVVSTYRNLHGSFRPSRPLYLVIGEIDKGGNPLGKVLKDFEDIWDKGEIWGRIFKRRYFRESSRKALVAEAL